MKKIILIGMIFMLAGCCSSIRQSEFFQHDTVYSDMHHLWFSSVGYASIDKTDVKLSHDRKWWGITKPYPPKD